LAKGETTSLPQNRVLYGLGDSKFDDGLGRNLDLLFRLGIEAGASLPFLLYDLAKAGQDEFAVLFDRFVGEVAYVSGMAPLPAKRSAFCVLRRCHCWCSLVSLM
jgi:hypothetical protein